MLGATARSCALVLLIGCPTGETARRTNPSETNRGDEPPEERLSAVAPCDWRAESTPELSDCLPQEQLNVQGPSNRDRVELEAPSGCEQEITQLFDRYFRPRPDNPQRQIDGALQAIGNMCGLPSELRRVATTSVGLTFSERNVRLASAEVHLPRPCQPTRPGAPADELARTCPSLARSATPVEAAMYAQGTYAFAWIVREELRKRGLFSTTDARGILGYLLRGSGTEGQQVRWDSVQLEDELAARSERFQLYLDGWLVASNTRGNFLRRYHDLAQRVVDARSCRGEECAPAIFRRARQIRWLLSSELMSDVVSGQMSVIEAGFEELGAEVERLDSRRDLVSARSFFRACARGPAAIRAREALEEIYLLQQTPPPLSAPTGRRVYCE